MANLLKNGRVKFFQNRVVLISFILLAFAGLSLVLFWRLDKAPPNVAGDEVTVLNDILRIIHAPGKIKPFSLVYDGSHSALGFYFLAFVVKFFSEENAILGMRVASVIFGIGVLVAFLVFLRTKFAFGPSLLATLLLGTNYVFLNMSRSSWMGFGSGTGLICGLLSFIFVDKAISKKQYRWIIVAGVFAGIGLYGYNGTKVFPFAIILYIVYLLCSKRIKLKDAVITALMFVVTTFIVFLPFLFAILDNYDYYMTRPRGVYIGSVPTPYYEHTEKLGIFLHQVSYTARGFLFLDPRVSGEGLENKRYGPEHEALVDPVASILFFAGVITLFYFRNKNLLLPGISFVLALVVQIFARYPPNFSRGIFALLFVYAVVAALFDRLWNAKLGILHLRFALLLLTVLIGLWSVQHYFQWGSSKELAGFRAYAIEYEEVPLWVEAQKEAIKSGKPDIIISGGQWKESFKSSQKIEGNASKSETT